MIRIEDMIINNLTEYADLFMSVFNKEPWNDEWTLDTSSKRIQDMMQTNTFVGKAIYDNNVLMGIIFGQKEQFYDGIHFQIQEFCVKTSEQKKGYGKQLLQALNDELKRIGVVNTYLITSKGERTEGYYQSRGFLTSDYMILMTKESNNSIKC